MFHRVESRGGGKKRFSSQGMPIFLSAKARLSSTIEFIFNSSDESFHETRHDFWKREILLVIFMGKSKKWGKYSSRREKTMNTNIDVRMIEYQDSSKIYWIKYPAK